MRNRFDEQLSLLHTQLIQMGALCEDAISAAMSALLNNERSMIARAATLEEEIDQKERDIEALCLKLLLQQQPVARDLRVISSALKMISDMERIGDQASDIAEIATFIADDEVKNRIHLREMANSAIKMVTDSVNSFVKRDLELAHEVMDYDDVVDDMFSRIKQELSKLIISDEQIGEHCLDLLMVAKYLERIGDHAVNIAEWVEFSITGMHAAESLS